MYKVIVFAICLLYGPLLFATELKDLIKLAEADLKFQAGKDYEGKAANALGQRLADVIQICVPKGTSNKGFDMVIVIDKAGATKEIQHTSGSLSAACIKKMILKFQYPSPPLESFRLHLDMKIED